jgi:hypothetical protein
MHTRCPTFLILAALSVPATMLHEAHAVEITHVHGLAYSADGKQLLVPSHHGLAIYRDGNIAQNPAAPKEYAIATFERSVFVSRDGGHTWVQIAVRGSGK